MIRFQIVAGALWLGDGIRFPAYSGYGDFKGKPEYCNIPHLGPIPYGYYKIIGPYKHSRLGPVCFNLEPEDESLMFGRSLFRIHGDNAEGNASHGCIVASRDCREAIAADKEDMLLVEP